MGIKTGFTHKSKKGCGGDNNAQHVDRHIGTAYDTVKVVSDNISHVIEVSEYLKAVVDLEVETVLDRLDENEKSISSLNKDVGSNDTELENHEGRIEALESIEQYDDTEIKSQVNDVDTRVETLEAIEAYDDTALTERTESLESKTEDNTNRISSLEDIPAYDDTDINLRVDTVVGELDDVESRVTALENEPDYTYDDSQVKTDISSNTDAIVAVENRVADLETAIPPAYDDTQVKADIADNTSKIEALENDPGYDDTMLNAAIQQNSADIQQVSTEVVSIEARVGIAEEALSNTGLENTVIALDVKVTKNESDIANINPIEIGTNVLMLKDTNIKGYRSLAEGDLVLPFGAYPLLEKRMGVDSTVSVFTTDTSNLRVSADFKLDNAYGHEGHQKIGKWFVCGVYKSGEIGKGIKIQSEDGSDVGMAFLVDTTPCSEYLGEQLVAVSENRIAAFDYLTSYGSPECLRIFELNPDLATAQEVADSIVFVHEDADALANVYGVSDPLKSGIGRQFLHTKDAVIFPPQTYHQPSVLGEIGLFFKADLCDENIQTRGYTINLNTAFSGHGLDFGTISKTYYTTMCDDDLNFVFVTNVNGNRKLFFINLRTFDSFVVEHHSDIDLSHVFPCYSRDGESYIILNSASNNYSTAYNIKDGSVAYEDTSPGLVQYLFDDGKEYVAIGRNETNSRYYDYTEYFKNGISVEQTPSLRPWQSWYSIIDNNTAFDMTDTNDLCILPSGVSERQHFASIYQGLHRNNPFFFHLYNKSNVISTTFYGISKTPAKGLIVKGVDSSGYEDKKWFVFTGEPEIDPSTGEYLDPNY